jgi:hypothetical protein
MSATIKDNMDNVDNVDNGKKLYSNLKNAWKNSPKLVSQKDEWDDESVVNELENDDESVVNELEKDDDISTTSPKKNQLKSPVKIVEQDVSLDNTSDDFREPTNVLKKRNQRLNQKLKKEEIQAKTVIIANTVNEQTDDEQINYGTENKIINIVKSKEIMKNNKLIMIEEPMKFMKENNKKCFIINEDDGNVNVLQVSRSKNDYVLKKINSGAEKSISFKRCTYSNCKRQDRRDHCYFHTEMYENSMCISLSDLKEICFDEKCKGNNLNCVIGNKKHIFPQKYSECAYQNDDGSKICKNYINPCRACLFHQSPNEMCHEIGILTEHVASGKQINLSKNIGNQTYALDDIDEDNVEDEDDEDEDDDEDDDKDRNTSSLILSKKSKEMIAHIKEEIIEHEKLKGRCENKCNKYEEREAGYFDEIKDIKRKMIKEQQKTKKNQMNIKVSTEKMCNNIGSHLGKLNELCSSGSTVDDIYNILEMLGNDIAKFTTNDLKELTNKKNPIDLRSFGVELESKDALLNECMRKKNGYEESLKIVNNELVELRERLNNYYL